MARYARVELLILDELAYVPLAQPEAELQFQVLDERSERSALIVTTNLPFGEWTKVFPEPRLCKAVVDQLTFNAHIVETGADSWRFKKTLERPAAEGGGRPKAQVSARPRPPPPSERGSTGFLRPRFRGQGTTDRPRAGWDQIRSSR